MPSEPATLFDFGDPAGAFAVAVDHLRRGVADPHHPFRWLTVATADADGRPQARVCVLRAVDADRRVVGFHTDCRSPKVAQLAADPRAGLLLYDDAAKFQLRLAVTVTLHHADAEARAAWDGLHAGARSAYAAADAPGAVVPPDADTSYPPADDAAFDRFVLCDCRFEELELLQLHPAGHRRARLVWRGGWVMERLAP